MALRNRFAVLAIDDEDVDVFDALDLEAFGYLAAPAPAALFGLLADHAAFNAAANPAPAPGTEDPYGEDELFGGVDLNQVLDEDPLIPWKLARSKVRRKGEKDTQPTVDVKTAVEVPWVAREGSLRSIRKNAQDRKGGYVQTVEGPGVFIYGSFGQDSLEF